MTPTNKDPVREAIEALEKHHKHNMSKPNYCESRIMIDTEKALTSLRALQERQVVDVEALKTELYEAFTQHFNAMPAKISGEYEIEWAINHLAAQGYLSPRKEVDVERERVKSYKSAAGSYQGHPTYEEIHIGSPDTIAVKRDAVDIKGAGGGAMTNEPDGCARKYNVIERWGGGVITNAVKNEPRGCTRNDAIAAIGGVKRDVPEGVGTYEISVVGCGIAVLKEMSQEHARRIINLMMNLSMEEKNES